MDLVGVHIAKAPFWPVRLAAPAKVPASTILLSTCNRVQYLCERKDRKHVLECFSESGIKEPEIYSDRECIHKMFEIAFGLDSVNYGNTIVRRQILESKNVAGTPRLKKIVSDIVSISETVVPVGGYRQFTTAERFLKNLGLRTVHIVTGGETVGDNSKCIWDPDAFDCDAVIFSGRLDKRLPEAQFSPRCKFCINFNMTFRPPERFNDLTALFDSHITKGGPVITNVTPLADLYWERLENEDSKRLLVANMKSFGISTSEIETLLGSGTNKSLYNKVSSESNGW
jgi:hypothetical protein